ncbi:MAG TPA: hypothetical protein VH723_06295 [Candidatus Limnocylindrales bacterium]
MIDDPTDVRQWRPQGFGRRAARHVDDPLVEPLWSGLRVLAHHGPSGVEFIDTEGVTQAWPETAAAVAAGLAAGDAILDGYLTTEAARTGVGVADLGPQAPTAGQMTRQMLIGGRNRRAELIDSLEAETPEAPMPGEEVVFVAVDILRLDGESLLDVPLLERKRLLDAVVVEGPLVRRGMHVRQPIDVWIGTWRNLGFRAMAFKDANSRYRPGQPNDDWAKQDIPRR